MQDILDGYAAAAKPDLIAAYEGLSPDCIYEHVIDLVPQDPVRAADIGAGTGRDAAWLAAKGHDVLAVEPVREFREAAQALHPAETITWLDDRLPNLENTRSRGSFDFVTLCAVWQHVPDEERANAMAALGAITSPGGVVVMSVRHGPGAIGRRIFPVDTDRTIDLARSCGLEIVRRVDAASVQPRNQAIGIFWTWLALRRKA